MNKEQKQIEKDLQLLRRISNKVFDIEHRVFLESERKIQEIIEWARTPKDKRKPAVNQWTSSPQRQVGYLIENLEFKLKEFQDDEKVVKNE